MSEKVAKFVTKWWFGGVLILLAGLYVYGYQKMYFYFDDLDWLMMANKPFWQMMGSPISDHVNYVFRLLLKWEWSMFHWNFVGFFTISMLLHLMVIVMLYLLAWASSGRRDLAAMAALIFTINTNWTEVVLWVSGQTISITALFVLISMYMIWKKKGEVTSLFLSSWTSSLALGLPVAAFLVYGINWSKKKISKIGYGAIVSLLFVLILMLWKRTDGTAIEMSTRWAVNVIMVSGLMTINSVIGRLFIPFDVFEMFRLVIVTCLMLFATWKYWRKISELWRDNWTRFLVINLAAYNLIVAIGRAQYGIGIMRAERYAYFGLVLFLLIAVRILRRWKINNWIFVGLMMIALQIGGLYQRSNWYVVKPAQLRDLVEQIENSGKNTIQPEAYLPNFVSGEQRLKYGDLLPLLDH